MALESATYIDGLNASNPAGSDAISTADDHLRLIKSTLKTTFPNVAGAVTKTHTQLNNALDKTGDTMTGPLTLSGNPSSSLHAATKSYVDGLVSGAGLGTMSTQNSNNVSITGGSISGVTFSSSNATISGGSIGGLSSLVHTSYNFDGTSSLYWTGVEAQIRIAGNMKFFVGNTSAGFSIGDVQKVGGGTFNSYSDVRYKQDVLGYSKGLTELKELDPKSFRYTPAFMNTPEPSKTYVGLIAQEVEQTSFADCVSNDQNGYKILDTSQLLFALINAVKELSAEVEALKNGSS